MGNRFLDHQNGARTQASNYMRNRFDKLYPIVLFRKKSGIFNECFDASGKLTTSPDKFWPRYLLDYEDFSLYAESVLKMPANILDICIEEILQEINPKNCFNYEEPQEDEIFLLRCLRV